MARVLISLPDDLLKELDDYCQEAHFNRSEFLRFFLREFIRSQQSRNSLIRDLPAPTAGGQ